MVPGRPLYIDGISYWIPDLSKLRSTLANTLGITLNSKYRSRMEEDIQEYERSIPADAKEVPASDTSIGRMTNSSDSRSDSQQKQSSSKRRSELKNTNETERTRSNDSASDTKTEPITEPVTDNRGSEAAPPTQNSTAGKSR